MRSIFWPGENHSAPASIWIVNQPFQVTDCSAMNFSSSSLPEARTRYVISTLNRISKLISRAILCSLLVCVACYNTGAQTLPAGFSQVLVANGIPSPTAMAFAPDGRIFVCQQNGQLRVVKNNVLLIQPMISLSVTSSGERGLIGIALDPNFATNHYIYLYYTLPTGTNNRISRFLCAAVWCNTWWVCA